MQGQEPTLGASLEQRLRAVGISTTPRQIPVKNGDKNNGRKLPQRSVKQEEKNMETVQHTNNDVAHTTHKAPVQAPPGDAIDTMAQYMRSSATDLAAIRQIICSPTPKQMALTVVQTAATLAVVALAWEGSKAVFNWLVGPAVPSASPSLEVAAK